MKIETQQCDQCEEIKSIDEFLDLKRRGWKITKCNTCAQENMRKWASTIRIGKNIDLNKMANG